MLSVPAAAASFQVQSVHAINQTGHTPTHISGNSQQPWKCQEFRADTVPWRDRWRPSRRKEGEEGRKKEMYAAQRRGKVTRGQSARERACRPDWRIQ